jgi:hypothetical protein
VLNVDSLICHFLCLEVLRDQKPRTGASAPHEL